MELTKLYEHFFGGEGDGVLCYLWVFQFWNLPRFERKEWINFLQLKYCSEFCWHTWMRNNTLLLQCEQDCVHSACVTISLKTNFCYCFFFIQIFPKIYLTTSEILNVCRVTTRACLQGGTRQGEAKQSWCRETNDP